MEDSSDTDLTPTKQKRTSVVKDKKSANKSSGDEHDIIPNGTGTNPQDSPEMDPVDEKMKPIKITKITKVKTGELKSPIKKEPSTPTTAEEKHPASPSTEDEFCGFESSTLNEEQKKKQDALLRILDELNASCSLAEEGEEEVENEVKKDSEDVEENGVDEDMTVDTDHVSDADSDQMEIDVEKDKDSAVVSDSPQEKAKDSDVESVKSAGDNISKSDNSDIKPTMTDANEETEVPAPETTLKGSGAKVEFCGTCDAEVNDSEEGICCDGDCERWFHLRCSGLTQAEYDELGLDENAKWACSRCSGVPPRSTANAKPLVTVRKDLGQFSTPSPLLLTKKRSGNREGRSPRIDIANPAFLKPFDFGWKRELVYRSTNDNQNRRQGDIYYYTPKGKKLRSLREISDYLAGTDLTQDNFTFWKEPLGVDDPDKEIIRDAKFKLVNKDPNASPGVISKKPITPKTQKTPKVLPKLTATVSPLDTSGSMKASASVTPRVVLKGKASPAAAPKFKVTPSKTTTPGQPQKIVISKDKKRKPASDDEMEMGMLPPMWEPIPKPKDKSAGVKRPLEESSGSPEAKRAKSCSTVSLPKWNVMQNLCDLDKCMTTIFQYLKVQELLRASRVCHTWHHWAFRRKLWESVRMKNSQVKDWEGFSATLQRVGTKHLDLRKILMPDKQDALKTMWNDCVKALSKVNTLVKLDLCRCTSYLLEHIAAACPQLEYISAGTIKSSQVNMTNLGNCSNLTELKLKGQGGMDLNNVSVLGNLSKLKHLSLTTIKNINEVLKAVGKLTQLESLELGDLCYINEIVVTESFSKLTKLKRLRLEKGQTECPTAAILTTIAKLPSLVQLELINFDVKIGFEEALGLCENIKILLIIPTYVTQSATTNHLVIEGVSKLSKTLNHFVWGLTLELLRVTDLFIDQWELGQKNNAAKNPNPAPLLPKKSTGDSIPILKPTVKDDAKEGAVTQVDVLQLPKLHKVLSALLPTTKIIILKVPFSATWRQTISNSSQ